MLLDYAVYYDPFDPRDVARALNEVLSLDEEQLIDHGRNLGEQLRKLSELKKIIKAYTW